MKKTAHVLILFFFFSIANTSFSQQEGTVSLSKIEVGNQEVGIYLTTSESFIVGSNRFVLYIGNRYFLKNTHPEGNVSHLLFLIPTEDFQQINGDDPVVLVYGFYDQNEGASLDSFTGKHWILGPLSEGTKK